MEKIIRYNVSLPAPSDALFEMYMDSVLHSEISGAAVTMIPIVGAGFRAFNGGMAVVPKNYEVI